MTFHQTLGIGSNPQPGSVAVAIDDLQNRVEQSITDWLLISRIAKVFMNRMNKPQRNIRSPITRQSPGFG